MWWMCGENSDPMYETFPILFALADSKEARVAEMWENPHFVRPFND